MTSPAEVMASLEVQRAQEAGSGAPAVSLPAAAPRAPVRPVPVLPNYQGLLGELVSG